MRPGLTFLRRLHVGTDCALVSIGWLGAYGLRFALNDVLATPINPFRRYVEALPLVVVPWVATCWLFGIYRGARMRTLVDELQALLRGAALGLLVVSALSFFFRGLSFGRFVVLASAANNLLLQGVSRVVFYRAERRLWRSRAHDVPVLIVGTGVAAIRLLQKLQDHPEIGYRVVGFLDDSGDQIEKDVAGHPVLGRVEDLREAATAAGVRDVFVADPSLGHTRMLSLVLDCEDLGIEFRVVTNLFEVLTAGTELDLVDDLPLVRLGRQRAHPLQDAAKRAFDVCGALLGLVVFAPLLLWCAWRIRATSPGPALFFQDRVGRDGRVFRMVKFRTMRQDAEHATGPVWTSQDDPRRTRLGAWLRQTSIDELPQLWNVLQGDMSLVGPRPERPVFIERFRREIPGYMLRHKVRAGLTGWAQVHGWRGDTSLHERVEHDIYYIQNWSLGLDLRILLMTLWRGWFHPIDIHCAYTLY